MQYDITVVIPTYNVEMFIRDALDSVLNQTFKGKVEIIVIDDASTDKTPAIIEQYKKMQSHFDIKVLYQEKNMRQGTARNRGINEAKGKYIFFLDGDDFLDPRAFQKMYNKAEKDSCDFVLCDWIYYFEDRGLVYVNNDRFLFNDLLVGEDCEDLLQAITFFTVNKLYKKDFLVNNGIKYGEGYIYEDFEFYVKVAQRAELIGIVQNPFYRVRVNEYSTTKTLTKSTLHVESFLKAVQSSLKDFQPRKKHSYYFLFKHLVNKALYYVHQRAPFGYKRKTLKRILKLMNGKAKQYSVPKNITPLNHLFFRRKYVQRGKVNLILFLYWLHRKKLLVPLFSFAKKQKQKLINTAFYQKRRQKRREEIINNYYKQPMDNDSVLFLGFDYRYVGNSKYFFDYLKENTNLKLFFVTKNKEVPDEFRVKPRSLKFYELLAKSKLVFAESWVPLDYKKRPESIWFQLWHGTPFKKLLFDSHEYYVSKNNKNHKRQKSEDISRWDFMLADSEVGKEKLSSGFNFDENRILDYGYPRVQWLKDNKDNLLLKEKIRNNLGISQGKKVILYVPTWRDYNFKQTELDFSYLVDLNVLTKGLKEEYVILNKQHNMEKGIRKFDNSILDPGNIEVQQLLLISDFIISDYSSIIFDGMAIDVPFFLFINDFKKYEEARGVYPDMHEVLRDFYVNTEDELIKKIRKGKESYPLKQYRDAKQIFCNPEGNDSNKELLKKVYELINRETTKNL